MAKQLRYEDIEIGLELPTLVKHPTTEQLVRFAGASGDYYQVHYDKDFAQASGLPGVIVHGWLTFSFMAQMLTDWIGEQAELKMLGCSYKKMHYPNEDLFCKGKVTKKSVEDGEHLVECEIWAENAKGEITTPGTAVFTLPA